jgi:hypothetical protein
MSPLCDEVASAKRTRVVVQTFREKQERLVSHHEAYEGLPWPTSTPHSLAPDSAAAAAARANGSGNSADARAGRSGASAELPALSPRLLAGFMSGNGLVGGAGVSTPGRTTY